MTQYYKIQFIMKTLEIVLGIGFWAYRNNVKNVM